VLDEIDEISYKRGHRQLTFDVDHETGRIVCAEPGRGEAALGVLLDELGEQRSAEITHVSADMADWIAKTVAARDSIAIQTPDSRLDIAVAFATGVPKPAARTLRICARVIPGTERGPADAMDEMFGTIPTTVTGWRGTSGGWDADSDTIQLSETQ
jgi:hypothetical protein